MRWLPHDVVRYYNTGFLCNRARLQHLSWLFGHTKDTKLVLLSKENREPREVASICGQCHLRGGKSKSSGLPFANTFVPGDNLFRDFEVDFSGNATWKRLPIDRHIFENTRDVVIFGLKTTCLSCHDVHGQSTEKHQELNDAKNCSTCHVPGSDHSELTKSFLESCGSLAHNTVCDY